RRCPHVGATPATRSGGCGPGCSCPPPSTCPALGVPLPVHPLEPALQPEVHEVRSDAPEPEEDLQRLLALEARDDRHRRRQGGEVARAAILPPRGPHRGPVLQSGTV